MFATAYPFDRPCLLIIAGDRATARRLVSALGRTCVPEELLERPRGKAAAGTCRCERSGGGPCCVLIASLAELAAQDLERPDAVVCSARLSDGSGLQALARIRARRPGLPVFLLGEPGPAAPAEASRRAGAGDFRTVTARDLPVLRVAVERHLVEERIRQLEAIARTDALTGLCNRRRLDVAHIDLSRQAGPEQLVGHADEALYAAKSAGKHRALVRNADGTCTCEPRPSKEEFTAEGRGGPRRGEPSYSKR